MSPHTGSSLPPGTDAGQSGEGNSARIPGQTQTTGRDGGAIVKAIPQEHGDAQEDDLPCVGQIPEKSEGVFLYVERFCDIVEPTLKDPQC